MSLEYSVFKMSPTDTTQLATPGSVVRLGTLLNEAGDIPGALTSMVSPTDQSCPLLSTHKLVLVPRSRSRDRVLPDKGEKDSTTAGVLR